VTPELDRAILGCLAPRPEQRPASAAALARELAAGLPEAVTRPLPGPTSTHATQVMTTATLAAATRVRQPRRPRGAQLLGALAVLGSLAVAGVVALLAIGGSGGAADRRSPAPVRPATRTNVPLTQQTTAPPPAFVPAVQKKPDHPKPHGKAHAKHAKRHAKHVKKPKGHKHH
jgi:hypothetical protein